jgi:hypothetical protein
MRRRLYAALDLVQMYHIQTVVAARIGGLTMHAAQGRPQREATDTAHAVDIEPETPLLWCASSINYSRGDSW